VYLDYRILMITKFRIESSNFSLILYIRKIYRRNLFIKMTTTRAIYTPYSGQAVTGLQLSPPHRKADKLTRAVMFCNNYLSLIVQLKK
jgi:hypothetical protein